MERNARRFHNGFAIFLPTFFLVMTVLHVIGYMDRPIPLRQNLSMDFLAVLFALFISSRANRKVTLCKDASRYEGGSRRAGLSAAKSLAAGSDKYRHRAAVARFISLCQQTRTPQS